MKLEHPMFTFETTPFGIKVTVQCDIEDGVEHSSTLTMEELEDMIDIRPVRAGERR